MSETCPKCGEKRIRILSKYTLFDCETAVYKTRGIDQSTLCKLNCAERELAALRAERERVLSVLRPACHSGVNLGEHTAVYRALREMGER